MSADGWRTVVRRGGSLRPSDGWPPAEAHRIRAARLPFGQKWIDSCSCRTLFTRQVSPCDRRIALNGIPPHYFGTSLSFDASPLLRCIPCAAPPSDCLLCAPPLQSTLLVLSWCPPCSGGDRLLPLHQPPAHHARPGASPDHIQRGPPTQAFDPGADPRPEPALLLHRALVPEERARAADAHEPA
eukprot:scaffold3114_cov114-Isochrysis_galbana.AAC.11